MMLVRFVAVALILFSAAELALTFAVQSRIPVTVASCVIRSLPAGAGLIILFKARSLAEWIANLLDG